VLPHFSEKTYRITRPYATALNDIEQTIYSRFSCLVGRKADWPVVLRFALPSAVTAMLGAALLNLFANIPPLLTYPP
jgi:uncharacterized membrane protein YfcA